MIYLLPKWFVKMRNHITINVKNIGQIKGFLNVIHEENLQKWTYLRLLERQWVREDTKENNVLFLLAVPKAKGLFSKKKINSM